jgi:hypothetical protein
MSDVWIATRYTGCDGDADMPQVLGLTRSPRMGLGTFETVEVRQTTRRAFSLVTEGMVCAAFPNNFSFRLLPLALPVCIKLKYTYCE